MAGARAAIRYAKALLSLTTELSTAEVVNNDMKLITATLFNSKALRETLQSPVVLSSVKKAIVLDVFQGADKLTYSLIDRLVTNNRIDILAEVAARYSALFDASKGIETATVTTAVPITEGLKEKVLAKAKTLTTKNVEVKNIVDANILGGFILRIGDIQYNASIANQLNKLKQEFTIN